MEQLVQESKGEIDSDQLIFMKVDISDFSSVRKFADDYAKQTAQVDTLILNAGIMKSERGLSKDGIEMTLATNHFGHFLLVHLLLPSLLAAESHGAKPRIIVLASALAYQTDVLDFTEF